MNKWTSDADRSRHYDDDDIGIGVSLSSLDRQQLEPGPAGDAWRNVELALALGMCGACLYSASHLSCQN